MWAWAYKKLVLLRSDAPHNNILMLGLASGSGVAVVQKFFPQSSVTAVEYDPAMIAVARRLKLFDEADVEILEGDAALVVPTLTKKFDIVVVDLFNGREPSLLASDASFLTAIEKILSSNGTLLINVYKRASYLEAAQKNIYTY
jgi:spermidine synthase